MKGLKVSFTQAPNGALRFWGPAQTVFMAKLIDLKQSLAKNSETVYFNLTFMSAAIGTSCPSLLSMLNHWEKQGLITKKGRINWNQNKISIDIDKVYWQWQALERLSQEIIENYRVVDPKLSRRYLNRKITFSEFFKKLGFTKRTIQIYVKGGESPQLNVSIDNLPEDLKNDPDVKFTAHLLKIKYEELTKAIWCRGDLSAFVELDEVLEDDKGWQKLRQFYADCI